MQFQRYQKVESFNADILDILLENEVRNNLMISILMDNKAKYADNWFMASVFDNGNLILAALCTKPFNILLFEAEQDRPDAMELLAHEIRQSGYDPPGVFAERGLANRFTEAYHKSADIKPHHSLSLMRIDSLADYRTVPGCCRLLQESDMFFVPYWEHAFSEECRVHVFSIQENTERIRTRIGKDTHFIWEDRVPVSQAVHGRNTPNGAIISWVYTPPHFRGRGYATTVVAELTRSLLERGKLFCCLFADADNPISCGIYRRLGYYDQHLFDDIRFA